MTTTTRVVGLVALGLAGCRIDVRLAPLPTDADADPITEGPTAPTVPADRSSALPDAPGPGTCDGHFLRLAGEFPAGAVPDGTLQQWDLTGGVTTDGYGGVDETPDLVYFPPPSPPYTNGVAILTSAAPFLHVYPLVGLSLDSSGPRPRVRTCDLDADGVDEVILADSGSPATLLAGWSGGFDGQTGLESPWAEFSDLACGDLDGDGTPEVLVAGPDGVAVYSPIHGKRFPFSMAPEATWSVAGGVTALSAIGDADEDGIADLAYAADGGVFRWEDGATAELGVPGDPEIVGDLDGDGADDLVVIERSADGAATASLLLGGPSDPWTEVQWRIDLGHTALLPQVVGLGDLDDDGFGEIAISTVGDDADGRFDVFRGAGSGLDPVPALTCAGGVGQELAIGMTNPGDFDGDGLDELVVTRIDPELYGPHYVVGTYSRSSAE